MNEENRRRILLALLVATLIFSLFSLMVFGRQTPRVSARAAILYDPVTREVLYSKSENEQLPMASTTKIMTALLALERLDPSEIITVPKEAVGTEGSSLYLKEGDEISANDLIYSLLLASANDAAVVLALAIGGDCAEFAAMMTARAHEIGALSTSYENPHGLDAGQHYTTAYDLALIAAEALSNERFLQICSTYRYEFNIGDTPRVLTNHNKLLKRYEGAIGVKTGYTRKSGRCLVSAAQREGRTLIAVTLNAPSDWDDHARLLDFGFSTYT